MPGNGTSGGEDEYFRSTPLYANGRLFTVGTNRRDAFALDPATGQVLWHWHMDEGIRWQKAPRPYSGRGLMYWTDGTTERVIVITPGYHLVSLDAKTGKLDPKFGKNGIVDLEEGLGLPLVPLAVDDSGPLIISEAAPARKARPGEKWDTTTKTGADGTIGIDPALGQIASSSPGIVVNDVVVVGNSAIHGYFPLRLRNLPGFIRGFDVRTGKQLWKFDLIPQAGEFGAETWKNGTKIGTPGMGKADAWATYSADPALGLVYIPVGEGLNDEYGGHRPGKNLFANSIVAIDVKTGQRQWHFQAVHHDIWDYDFPMAPNLLDVTVDGRPRKIIAATTKQGWVYVLDRVTGQPIWPMPETPVEQERSARRGDVAHAADSQQAGAIRTAGTAGIRSHRLHAGDQGLGAQAREAMPHGSVLHPGVSGRRIGARPLHLLVVRAGRSRGREHRRRGRGGSDDGDALCSGADGAHHDGARARSLLRAPLQPGAQQLRPPGRATQAGELRARHHAVQPARIRRSCAHDDRRRVDPQAERVGRHHRLRPEQRGQSLVDGYTAD